MGIEVFDGSSPDYQNLDWSCLAGYEHIGEVLCCTALPQSLGVSLGSFHQLTRLTLCFSGFAVQQIEEILLLQLQAPEVYERVVKATRMR